MLEAFYKIIGLKKHKFPCQTIQYFRGMYKGEMNVMPVELKK